MYNKIASIISNPSKTSGLSDIFIAQPDSLKENLAGKVFIIADINGKKNDGRKILDFLISSLEENYYNDEKILLRDKIEGLKVENIFEAAISKTNKALNEFLLAENIKLNISSTSLTIGVVYESKLYFSSFGKNHALLIYRHGEKYEIINVEANVNDVNLNSENNTDRANLKIPSIFSSVISGEIPIGAYFVFAGEALLEYLPGKDLINIITKLPPIVAAEQIKNILTRINSFIPFLGIIIKNTTGIDNQESHEEEEKNLSAHSSISSLNHTEQKTEQMLAPAGLISFSKLYKNLIDKLKNLKPKQKIISKKIYRSGEENNVNSAVIDIARVKSLDSLHVNSFLIKEKIFFKKKQSSLDLGFKKITLNLASIFRPQIFSNLKSMISKRLDVLSKKNRLLFIILAIFVFIFISSLWFTNWTQKQQAVKNNYNNLVASIEDKQNTIDSYLLYNNEEGAKKLLSETRDLLNYLPKIKKDHLVIYTRLNEKLNLQANKIEKIVKVENLEKVNDLSGLNINNLIFIDNKIYAAGGNSVYSLIPQQASTTKLEIPSSTNLINPQFDKKSLLYYWDNNKLLRINLKNNQTNNINISDQLITKDQVNYGLFNGGKYLYILEKEKNQIYRYNCANNICSAKVPWFKDVVNLSSSTDFFVNSIDGRIYVLNANGEVNKFYIGKTENYVSATIFPVITSANKIIVGANYIYIFEANTKRLIVLAIKDGHLMNQYQVDSLVKPRDFTIDEVNNIAYFLDSNAIYKLKLN